MTFFKWSQTASANGNADNTCPAPEGWSPAQVNNSMRGMMAAAAKYRDDMSGQIVTAGTATAYTLLSFQGFTDLAAMHGKTICFTPHFTNGANGTSLNVDGLGVKPILTAPGKGLPGGVLVAGTPYGVLYNNTDGAFYVMGLFGSPSGIPIGGGIDYWGTALPNSNFVFPVGQAISRTTYAEAFAIFGTTHGAGNGVDTFNLPDVTGRLRAMKEAVATRLTTAGSGIDGATMGAVGGAQSKQIKRSDLPNEAPTFAGTAGVVNVSGTVNGVPVIANQFNTGTSPNPCNLMGTTNYAFTASGTFTPQGTVQSLNGGVTQTGLAVMPPTIVCNYMIRII